MRTRTTTSIGAALLLATLTACSSGSEPGTIRATVTETVTAQPEEKPAAEPTDVGSLKLGTAAKFKDETTSATATVLAYTQPAKGPQPPGEELGGDAWATAEVKVCNTSAETFTVSQSPWSLAYADGTRTEVTGLNGGDLPKPEFPSNDVNVKTGDCVRGKIPYPVHSKTRPERIVYAPDDLEPIEWAIPRS